MMFYDIDFLYYFTYFQIENTKNMKTRTLYDVLDKVMRDYTYIIKKEDNQIYLSVEVYIKQLDQKVTYEKKY